MTEFQLKVDMIIEADTEEEALDLVFENNPDAIEAEVTNVFENI